MSAASAPSQTAMKRLAGALSFVCLVLFLLAVEQKQTVAAWESLRAGAGPIARGVADWAGRLPSGAADGLEGLKTAVAGEDRPIAHGDTIYLTAADKDGNVGNVSNGIAPKRKSGDIAFWHEVDAGYAGRQPIEFF